jgi:hypothetical protein
MRYAWDRLPTESATAPWYVWAQKHDWAERAAAYDRHHIDTHSALCAQEVIPMLRPLAQEGIAAVKEERTLFLHWRDVSLLHALAQLVSPVKEAAREAAPLPVARVYSAAELLHGAGGVSPNNPGRPFAPGTASASPN